MPQRHRTGGTPLSSASPTTQTALPPGSPAWQRQAKLARLLSWLSLIYMAAEGAIAVTAAIIAGSVALLGFGLDSVIEGLASIIIVWRFTGTRTLSETAERRAQKAVAVTFFLLAPYIAIDAIRSLVTAEHAKTSWLGIGLSIASLIVMPLLGTGQETHRRPPGLAGHHRRRRAEHRCAPTWPSRSWPDYWPTRRSGCGGRPRHRPRHRRPGRPRRPRSLGRRRRRLRAIQDLGISPRRPRRRGRRGRAARGSRRAPAQASRKL